MYTPNKNRYNNMLYNRCGKSGLKLSAISLGFWQNFGYKSRFDVMEEMVGDIYDEHDDEVIVPSLIKVSDNTYDVDPDINLEDLFEQLEIENVPETEYSSLGGYLYELCENLPEVNQKLEVIAIDEQMDDHGNLISKTITMEFTLTEVEDMRIKKVRLVIDPIKPEDAINKEEK